MTPAPALDATQAFLRVLELNRAMMLPGGLTPEQAAEEKSLRLALCRLLDTTA